jgi:hypothetical protein
MFLPAIVGAEIAGSSEVEVERWFLEIGKKLGGLRAFGLAAKQAAIERAKALAPIFAELDGPNRLGRLRAS